MFVVELRLGPSCVTMIFPQVFLLHTPEQKTCCRVFFVAGHEPGRAASGARQGTKDAVGVCFYTVCALELRFPSLHAARNGSGKSMPKRATPSSHFHGFAPRAVYHPFAPLDEVYGVEAVVIEQLAAIVPGRNLQLHCLFCAEALFHDGLRTGMNGVPPFWREFPQLICMCIVAIPTAA